VIAEKAGAVVKPRFRKSWEENGVAV